MVMLVWCYGHANTVLWSCYYDAVVMLLWCDRNAAKVQYDSFAIWAAMVFVVCGLYAMDCFLTV